MSIPVQFTHNEKDHKFYISYAGNLCYLMYEKIGDGIMHFSRLFIPKSLRNYNLSKQLVEESIKYAFTHNFKISSSCEQVNSFLQENTRYHIALNTSANLMG